MAKPMERLPVKAACSVKEHTRFARFEFGCQFGYLCGVLRQPTLNVVSWKVSRINFVFAHILTLRPVVPWSSIVNNALIGRAIKAPAKAACRPRRKHTP